MSTDSFRPSSEVLAETFELRYGGPARAESSKRSLPVDLRKSRRGQERRSRIDSVAFESPIVPIERPRLATRRVGPIKAALIAVDLVALITAMILAYALRTRLAGNSPAVAAPGYLILGAASLPVWLCTFFRYRLYSARHVASSVEEARRAIHAIATVVALMALAAFASGTYLARSWLVLTFLFTVVFVLGERAVVRTIFRRLRSRGRLLWPILIVGDSSEADALTSMFEESPPLGYKVVGRLDGGSDMMLGDCVTKVLDLVRRTGATGVILAPSTFDTITANRLIRLLSDEGIHVELSSYLRDVAARRLRVRTLGRFPVVYIEPSHGVGWHSTAKRIFDVAFSSVILTVLSPMLVAIAVAVRLTSKGPVLFRQERLGRNGHPLELLKFRSMVVDAEQRLPSLRDRNEASGPLFKLKADPRITPVGRVLRRFSLDEFPQLWNVIRGDMSLIGPRPALPQEVAGWSPELHRRLRVRPGITGMWQVSGRSDTSFEQYSRLDIYYVENWSLGTDLAILAKTLPRILRGTGAY